MTAPVPSPIPADLRDRILGLELSRFRPDDEVLVLEQECYFAHPLERVSTEFRKHFLTLLPPHLQQTQPIADGPLRVGSRLIATPMFLTRPLVAVEILALDPDRFAYGYLERGPFCGRNTIRFSRDGAGTTATVTLRYQLVGILTAIGWRWLGGARFHRRLIAEGFRTLDRLLASQAVAPAEGAAHA